MNSPATTKSKQAFTLIELLVVLTIGALFFLYFIRSVNRGPRSKAPVMVCLSNQKQVVIGFLMYSSDQGQFPWGGLTNTGDPAELLSHSVAAHHFAKLTPYLRVPKTFVCPTDPQRQAAATDFAGWNNSNLSYFVSLDASLVPVSTNVFNLILSGDRHLAFNAHPVKPGLFAATKGAALSWTKELHWVKNQTPTLGVLAFADGHCEVVKATTLPATFQRQNLATNRLVVP